MRRIRELSLFSCQLSKEHNTLEAVEIKHNESQLKSVQLQIAGRWSDVSGLRLAEENVLSVVCPALFLVVAAVAVVHELLQVKKEQVHVFLVFEIQSRQVLRVKALTD